MTIKMIMNFSEKDEQQYYFSIFKTFSYEAPPE
jgi:hypothetical protein